MKRIIPVLLVIALLMGCTNFAALAEGDPSKGGVSVCYNEHDSALLREFLETEDENGVKNGDKLTIESDVVYDPDDPSTWRFLTWNDEGEIERIAFWSYNFAHFINQPGSGEPVPMYDYELLVGTLDVSGMQSLQLLNIPQNRISGIIADDCPNLMNLACHQNPELVSVSARNDPSVSYLAAADCSALETLDISGSHVRELQISDTPLLTEIDLSNCKSRLIGISASNSGLTSVDLSGMTILQQASFDSCPLSSIDLTGITSSFSLSLEYTGIETLDFSEAVGITSLDLNYSQVRELNLTGCEELMELLCEGTPLERLDTTDSPGMYLFDLMGSTALTDADISAYGNTLSVSAENGCFDLAMVLYYYAEMTGEEGDDLLMLNAYPTNEEAAFLGWFKGEDGSLLCEDMSFMPDQELLDELHEGDLSLIARFERIILMGDVTGDGSVAVEDALLVLRGSMGLIELTPEQIELADMNGSGAVELVDALIILRTAMGLI